MVYAVAGLVALVLIVAGILLPVEPRIVAYIVAALLADGVLIDNTRRKQRQLVDPHAIQHDPPDTLGYRSWFDMGSLASSGVVGAVLALVHFPILWVADAAVRGRRHREH